jgi:hypothetical protein
VGEIKVPGGDLARLGTIVSASGAWMRGRRGIIGEGLSARGCLHRRGFICVG